MLLRLRRRLPIDLRRLPMAIICAAPGTPPRICRGLYYFWLDGLFISLSASFYGTFMPLFIIGFGGSNSQIGLMSGLNSLAGIVALLYSAQATAAIGGRKRMVVFSRFAARLVLVAIAAVPFVSSGQLAVYLTIALTCIQVTIENAGSPAWTGLIADIVPLPIRARFIASRTTAKAIARSVAVAAAGWLIRSLTFPLGYQTSFVVGAVVGLGAAFAYSRIPVDGETRGGPAPRISLRMERPLLLYVLARTVWALGYSVAAPFYSVFLVRSLGGDAGTVGLFGSLNAITAVLGLVVFARLVERRGLRRAWLLAAVFEAMVPWIWAVVPGAWFGAVPSAIDGLLLAGLELINLNTLLLLTGAEKRAQFLAIYSAILSTAAMVGPLLGGALSDRFGLPPVFALAGALSLAGCALYYAFVPEPPEVAVCRIGESP